MLKKTKSTSSPKKKSQMLKKSALKKNKLNNSGKVGRPAKIKKGGIVKKTAAGGSIEMALPKAQGVVDLEKQWARAKKAWIKAIQMQIKQASQALKQDTKTLAEAKTKTKKSVQAAKAQKTAMLKLQKKVNKAQKALAGLKQLLLKAQAMNKLLSQFNKEWKVSVVVAKPKKTAETVKAPKSAKRKMRGRLAKKMTDMAVLGLDMSENEQEDAAAPTTDAEAA